MAKSLVYLSRPAIAAAFDVGVFYKNGLRLVGPELHVVAKFLRRSAQFDLEWGGWLFKECRRGELEPDSMPFTCQTTERADPRVRDDGSRAR